MRNERQIVREAEKLTKNLNYSKQQIAVIIIAIKEGLPTENLLNKDYNFHQMLQILKGLRDKIDVSIYAFPTLSDEKMDLIRNAVKTGADLSKLISSRMSMNRIKLISEIIKNDDLEFIDNWYSSELSSERLKLMYEGYKNDYPISFLYESNIISDVKIPVVYELISHLDGQEIEDYLYLFNDNYSLSQLREIVLALEEGLNISLLTNPDFSQMQLRQIRLGLLNNLDVSKYADPRITTYKMKEKRIELMNELTEKDKDRIHKNLTKEAYSYSKSLLN